MTHTVKDAPSGQNKIAEVAFLAFHDLSPDGFMMFTPVRAQDGTIVDLEWIFSNKAGSAMIGYAPDDLVGRRLLIELPGNKEEGLFDAYVSVIETGQTWQNEFFYDHGDIKGWFRTTATRAGEGLALSFADISEIRKGDERLRNLIDGVLAFVGVVSLEGTLLEANDPAVLAAGVGREELIGVPFWECVWWDIDQDTKDRVKAAVAQAASGEKVRYDAEIRVAGGQRLWIDFQIAPVLNSDGEVTELIPSGVDITERKDAETRREFLVQELSHRVKNTLATIQSIAGQTSRTADTMEDFRSSFNARLRSISASHDLLVKFDHRRLPLIALIQGQVMSYAADEARLNLVGEDVLLAGQIAHSMGLILHELASNASKYGALSNDHGKVTVEWHIKDKDEKRTLQLTWTERGGPTVAPPTRQGFGTRLIERSLRTGSNIAELSYDPIGFSCRLEMVLV